MELERRGFLRAVGSLALGCGNCTMAFGQTSTGELEMGSGSVHLEGRLKSGLLVLDAQDFLDRADHSVVVRGKLDTMGLYSAMFSHQKDLTVFALFRDNDHSTTVVLSDSEEAKIGHLVVWNDNQTPQPYKIDKSKIIGIKDPSDIVDVNSKRPDLVGKRRAAAFTWQELENVFGSDPALLVFMRGKKSTHYPRDLDEWVCHLLCMVPGSTLSLFWRALYPPPSTPSR
jgi:hypothetical protein